MSIIVTNEITVPAERAEMIVAKFAQNAGGMKELDGFQGFQLCHPTDPEDGRWLVVTHWRDETAYEAWRQGRHFGHSHGQEAGEAERKHREAKSVVRHYVVEFNSEQQ